MARTFEILESKLDGLTKEFARLAKRAGKLGINPPVLTVTGNARLKKFDVLVPESDDYPMLGQKTVERLYRVVEVAVEGAAPVLNGWTLVGILEHVEGETICHSIDNAEVPAKFRTAKPICDHCNVLRRRNDTFVVRHENGTFKQVGRQCLGDFLGSSEAIYSLAAEAELVIQGYLAAASCEDFEGFGGRGELYASLVTFLAWTYSAVRSHGWLSRSKAQENGGKATADRVWMTLFPSPFARIKAEDRIEPPTDADIAKAEETVDFVINQWSDDNEFASNLRAIARIGGVRSKHAGYAASMSIVFDRELSRRAEAAKPRIESQYVGTVGKREVFALTLEKKIVTEGHYGVTTICKFVDASGNRFVWFGSGHVELDEGEVHVVKATVKEHKVDNYNKQQTTYLSRVSPHVEKAKGKAKASASA